VPCKSLQGVGIEPMASLSSICNVLNIIIRGVITATNKEQLRQSKLYYHIIALEKSVLTLTLEKFW